MGDALAGRVVLVTGSSRGIGAEIAVKAGAEGARVAVHFGRSAEGSFAKKSNPSSERLPSSC